MSETKTPPLEQNANPSEFKGPNLLDKFTLGPDDLKRRETLSSITTWRRRLGYLLGGGSICGVGLLGWQAFVHLAELVGNPGIDFPRLCVLLGANVGVTAALVFFLYQVLKAAERMVIPASWIESNPHVMAALVGIKDPLSMLPANAGETIASAVAKGLSGSK